MSGDGAAPGAASLARVMELWRLDAPCAPLRCVTNHVFLSERDGVKCVVRMSRAWERPVPLIESELAFIDAAARGGVRAVAPWESARGARVEVVGVGDGEGDGEGDGAGDGDFHACVFPFAPGAPARGTAALVPEVLREWGATLARLHTVAESYTPPAGVPQRPHWEEEAVLKSALAARGVVEIDARELGETLEVLRGPESRNDSARYGTIHADVHPGNFFVDRGALVLFDFDDACRHWYLYDIASSVSALLQARRDFGQDDSPSRALDDLLRGYLELRPLASGDAMRVLAFVRFRLLLIRCWWKARMEAGVGTAALEEWGRGFDPWAKALGNALPRELG